MFVVALASAAEVTSCLDIALANDYLADEVTAESLSLADRVRAMTYRLSTK